MSHVGIEFATLTEYLKIVRELHYTVLPAGSPWSDLRGAPGIEYDIIGGTCGSVIFSGVSGFDTPLMDAELTADFAISENVSYYLRTRKPADVFQITIEMERGVKSRGYLDAKTLNGAKRIVCKNIRLLCLPIKRISIIDVENKQHVEIGGDYLNWSDIFTFEEVIINERYFITQIIAPKEYNRFKNGRSFTIINI